MIPCWWHPKLLTWCWSWYCIRPGKPYDNKFVAFTDNYWIGLDLPLDSQEWARLHRGLEQLSHWRPQQRLWRSTDKNDGVEVYEGPGICTTLSYDACADDESKIGDAMWIHDTLLMPNTWSLTRFFCCLYGQRTSSWGHTANLEDTMSASAEVNDLMMELMLHMTRGIVRLTSSSPSRTSTELLWIYHLISRVSRTSQWTRETELKYAKDQGFCTTLRYVVFTDGKNNIRDAMWIQNTALDASRRFVDPVFSERLLLALCCCFSRASNANGDALRIQSTTCWRQPKLLTYCRSWNTAYDQGNRYDFEFVASETQWARLYNGPELLTYVRLMNRTLPVLKRMKYWIQLYVALNPERAKFWDLVFFFRVRVTACRFTGINRTTCLLCRFSPLYLNSFQVPLHYILSFNSLCLRTLPTSKLYQ